MYDLQLKHKLGNSLEIWKNIRDVRLSLYKGPVAIRSLISGLGLKTHIDQNELEVETEEYIEEKGCTRRDIIYSEMVAPSMGIRRLLNAQIIRSELGLYSTPI